jgi:TolA-binding protein
MQIALEKEFQAKEQLIDENQQLRAELDSKAHKIADLHAQIEQLQRDSSQYQLEIKELNSKLIASASAAAAAASLAPASASTPLISSASTPVPSSNAPQSSSEPLECAMAIMNSLSLVVRIQYSNN